MPNDFARSAETLLKRKLYAVEADSVLRLSRLYASAYADLRNGAMARAEGVGVTTLGRDRLSSQWRTQFEQYANQRINTLHNEVIAEATRAATTATLGMYYGRLWMLDSMTSENTPINKPAYQPLQEADRYDTAITELLGREWRAQYATEMDSLTVELRRAIGTGMTEGEGIPAIMRRVAGTMGVETDRRRGAVGSVERRGYRANFNRVQTLTRTMVNQVSNEGALAAYRANGDIIIGYEWLAALDERTCPICQRLNGKFFTRDDGYKPPAHPNCRCTIIPVLNAVQMERPREMPPEQFTAWADGWGHRREIADFMNMPTLKPPPARVAPTEITTIDGVFKPPISAPGDTLDSLNAFMAENPDSALSYAMGDYEIGMLKVDYSRADDYFLIDRQVVKQEAAAFVQESLDIRYGKDYLLQLAQERAAENVIALSGDALEAAFNAQYAARAEAIETLARVDGIKLTPAQYRRLAEAREGGYLDMVYSREGSSTGSLQNTVTRATNAQRKPGGSANMSAGAREEARANFREWVQGIER